MQIYITKQHNVILCLISHLAFGVSTLENNGTYQSYRVQLAKLYPWPGIWFYTQIADSN